MLAIVDRMVQEATHPDRRGSGRRARTGSCVTAPMGPAPDGHAASVIHLDTSILVDALTGPRRSAPALRGVLDQGEAHRDRRPRPVRVVARATAARRSPASGGACCRRPRLCRSARVRLPWPPSCIGWYRARASVGSTSAWPHVLGRAVPRSGRSTPGTSATSPGSPCSSLTRKLRSAEPPRAARVAEPRPRVAPGRGSVRSRRRPPGPMQLA